MQLRGFLRRGLLPVTLVGLIAIPTAGHSQTESELTGLSQITDLSLTDAKALAREYNPGYLTQRNQLRSARWNVRSAYGDLLPSLNTSTGFSYTAGGERRLDSVLLQEQPAQLSSRYSLGLSLTLNGNTLLAPSVAKAQARATDEQVEAAQVTLDADVTQRYLTVLEARDQVEQAERELNRTAEHVRLAEARFEVGAGTQLDIRRAEVQRGQAEVQLVQVSNTAANEVLALSQLIGSRIPAEVELTEQFDLFEPTWSVDELVNMALSENPTLRASRAQADAATTRVRAARSAYLPSVSFSAGLQGFVSQSRVDTGTLIADQMQSAERNYASCLEANQIRSVAGLGSQSCSLPTEDIIREQIEGRDRFPFDYVRQPASASLTFSLPVFNGLNRELQVEQARIARLDAQYQVRAQELQVEVDIETALRNLETAHRTALLQQQVRETAEEELRLAEERFRFGASTSVEVVDAQASLAEAERAEIAAVYAFHQSIAILEARLGEPLPR